MLVNRLVRFISKSVDQCSFIKMLIPFRFIYLICLIYFFVSILMFIGLFHRTSCSFILFDFFVTQNDSMDITDSTCPSGHAFTCTAVVPNYLGKYFWSPHPLSDITPETYSGALFQFLERKVETTDVTWKILSEERFMKVMQMVALLWLATASTRQTPPELIPLLLGPSVLLLIIAEWWRQIQMEFWNLCGAGLSLVSLPLFVAGGFCEQSVFQRLSHG